MSDQDKLKATKVYNDVVDEQIDLDNPEDVLGKHHTLKNQPIDEVHDLSEGGHSMNDVPSPHDEEDEGQNPGQRPNPNSGANRTAATGAGSAATPVWLGYNPAEYKNLNISPEIKDLFKHITNYTPEVYELETSLKPFIPEYIPAIGEVDAFIKIPRPDGEDEKLGINIVDEPKFNQSKRAVIDKILDELGRRNRSENSKVHSINNASKNPREIQTWIDNIDKIQKNRFAPSVVYSNKMPDVVTLMQPWDAEFEKILDENPLPEDVQLTIPIEDLARYSCALLDIPVHDQNKEKGLIESVHLLFSLYTALNQHNQGQENQANSA